MIKNFLMTLLLSLVCIEIGAMNTTPPPPSNISRQLTGSPADIPSPEQARMRARGVRRNLAATLENSINPIIYTVLPRPSVTPPNLNIHPHLIVNDWFFSHVTSEQEALLNRIATVIPQAQRIMLSTEEYRLIRMFPSWIFHELTPFITFSDNDVETTEVVPSSESSEPSVKRSRKGNPNER